MSSHNIYRSLSQYPYDSSQLAANNIPIGTTAILSPLPYPTGGWSDGLDPNDELTTFSDFRYPINAAQSSQITSNASLIPNTYMESNEKKFDLKQLTDCLGNLKQNNDSFQMNILTELRQLREAVDNMKNSLQELPIRFADVLTHCVDLVNTRSENASVNSEPEVIDIFDKIDIKTDGIEDDFVEVLDKSEITQNLDSKSGSTVDKFVFEYNSYIDLDKWLKKD